MITTPQERQSTSNAGLRDRLFATLDAVIDGEVGKEQVEAVCFISEQIQKSGKLDLEFENAAQERLKLESRLEREKGESIKMLTEIIEEV